MSEVVGIIVQLVPWIFILYLANLADRQREHGQADSGQVLAAITYGLLGLLFAGFVIAGVIAQVAGTILSGNPSALASGAQQAGIDPAALVAALPRVGLGLWVPSLVGIALLLPPVRRLIARAIPTIDPQRTVHAVALSYTMLLLVNLLVTVGIGLGNLASLMEASAQQGAAFDPIPSFWTQDILFALMGLIGVGWLSRRNLGNTLKRLAIVVPRPVQVAMAVGAAIVMVPSIMVLEYAASQLGFGPGSDVERLSEQLLGPLGQSIPGILTLGLAAALGEETIFRGALQPRFGLLLTSLLFALAHSTDGLTAATLLLFIAGLVLGLVRNQANTTASMVVHALYNMSLGLITYLGVLR